MQRRRGHEDARPYSPSHTRTAEHLLSELSNVSDGPEVQSIGDVKMELKPGQEGLGGVDVRVEDALKTLQTCQLLLRNMGKTIFKRRKPAAV